MHTVIETDAYLRAARDAKMSPEEQIAAALMVSAGPESGVIIKRTGGVRNALGRLTAGLRDSLIPAVH